MHGLIGRSPRVDVIFKAHTDINSHVLLGDFQKLQTCLLCKRLTYVYTLTSLWTVRWVQFPALYLSFLFLFDFLFIG